MHCMAGKGITLLVIKMNIERRINITVFDKAVFFR